MRSPRGMSPFPSQSQCTTHHLPSPGAQDHISRVMEASYFSHFPHKLGHFSLRSYQSSFIKLKIQLQCPQTYTAVHSTSPAPHTDFRYSTCSLVMLWFKSFVSLIVIVHSVSLHRNIYYFSIALTILCPIGDVYKSSIYCIVSYHGITLNMFWSAVICSLFRFAVLRDPANWLSVNPVRGTVNTSANLDRESPYVHDNKYTAIFMATDNGKWYIQ